MGPKHSWCLMMIYALCQHKFGTNFGCFIKLLWTEKECGSLASLSWNHSKVKLCYFYHFEESPSELLSTYTHSAVAHLTSNKTSFKFPASLKAQLLAYSLRFLVAVCYFFSFLWSHLKTNCSWINLQMTKYGGIFTVREMLPC